MKILYAEDDRTIQDITMVILKRRTNSKITSIDAVANGEELVRKALEDKNYGVIMTDMNMGGITGYQAIQQIRENGIKTPVVIYSGQKGEAEKKATEKYEHVSHITKGDVAGLVAEVSKHLR
jgi:two-component system alkaline phosphatase synthesis response regulator PhoP